MRRSIKTAVFPIAVRSWKQGASTSRSTVRIDTKGKNQLGGHRDAEAQKEKAGGSHSGRDEQGERLDDGTEAVEGGKTQLSLPGKLPGCVGR